MEDVLFSKDSQFEGSSKESTNRKKSANNMNSTTSEEHEETDLEIVMLHAPGDAASQMLKPVNSALLAGGRRNAANDRDCEDLESVGSSGRKLPW